MLSRYASLKQGLVGAWCPSVSGSFGYRLPDLSSYGNAGTLTNMDPGTDWVPSGGKLALDFDGGGYVSIARRAADFGLLSLSLWFLPRAMSGTQRGLIDWADSPGSGAPFILITQQDPGTLHRIYVDADYRATINTIANTWNLITMCQEPGFLWRFHLNGVSVGTYQDDATSAYKANATGIHLGAGYAARFIGQIDDVRIYNRALTPSEIRLLYTGGRGVGLIPERIKHRRKTTAAATNRRRRLICGANC